MKEKVRRFWKTWKIERLVAILAAWYVFVLILMRADLPRFSALRLALLLLATGLPVAGMYFSLAAERRRKAREKARLQAARKSPARKSTAPAPGKAAPPPRQYDAYSDDERETVERYIDEAFGRVTRVFYDGDNTPFRIDVAVSEPEESRNFYTLTTVGMGERRMSIPPELAEKNRAFAELSICLPPDWDLMDDTWPFRVLKETAKRPFTEFDHIAAGNAYRGEMMAGSGFHGVLVLPAAVREGSRSRLMLASGKVVNFFLLLPILEDEWNFILARHDSYALWQRYAQCGGSVVVDPLRESCVDWDESEDMTEEESE